MTIINMKNVALIVVNAILNQPKIKMILCKRLVLLEFCCSLRSIILVTYIVQLCTKTGTSNMERREYYKL
jgi:hypothetical protein